MLLKLFLVVQLYITSFSEACKNANNTGNRGAPCDTREKTYYYPNPVTSLYNCEHINDQAHCKFPAVLVTRRTTYEVRPGYAPLPLYRQFVDHQSTHYCCQTLNPTVRPIECTTTTVRPMDDHEDPDWKHHKLSAVFCSEANLIGYCEPYSLHKNEEPKCVNAAPDFQLKSAHVVGNCIRVYAEPDCKGQSINLDWGNSPQHKIIQNIFPHQIKSVSFC